MEEKSLDNIFYNEYKHRAICDYVQFKTCILTSCRGGAKTFDVQKQLLDDLFRRGKFFAIIRESQVEIDEMLAGGYWDANLTSRPGYNKHYYEIKGNRVIIDGIIVGIAVALTTYGTFRGVALNLGGEAIKDKKERERLEKEIEEAESFVTNNVDKLLNIHFDEFEPISPKLSNERRYTAFKHICETLFRFRTGVRVYMCGNIENAHNAFLEKFGFGDASTLKDGIKTSYVHKPDGHVSPLAVWAHFTPSKDWQNMRANSYVGELSLIDGSAMFTTGVATQNATFPKLTPQVKRYVMYKINTGERMLGVWRIRDANRYQITSEPKGQAYPVFCLKTKDLITGGRLLEPQHLSDYVAMLENNMFEFENAGVYESFLNMLPTKGRAKKWK